MMKINILEKVLCRGKLYEKQKLYLKQIWIIKDSQYFMFVFCFLNLRKNITCLINIQITKNFLYFDT